MLSNLNYLEEIFVREIIFNPCILLHNFNIDIYNFTKQKYRHILKLLDNMFHLLASNSLKYTFDSL